MTRLIRGGNTVVGLLLLVFGGIACDRPKSEPKVKVELRPGTLYVGESPWIRVTVTAPRNRDVRVVRADTALARGCLSLVVVDPSGLWQYANGPEVLRVNGDDDFSVVPAGQTRDMHFAAAYRSRMPGQHVVHVQFTPTPDKDYVIDEVLTAEFKTIPASDVVCKVRLPVPHNPYFKNVSDWGTVEFMNVRTEKGYQMLFHHMNDRGDTTLEAVS